MTHCLLALLVGFAFPAEDETAFQSIRVQQTGGFAGVNVVYEIGSNGTWHRIAKTVPRKGTTKGELAEKDLAALRKAIAGIDWKTIPKKSIDENVADDFQYEIRVVIGKQKHTLVTDGSSAAKNAALKAILDTLRQIETAGRNES